MIKRYSSEKSKKSTEMEVKATLKLRNGLLGKQNIDSVLKELEKELTDAQKDLS